MMIPCDRGKIIAGTISINFLRYFLSDLLFCLAFILPTNMLNKPNTGFKLDENSEMNHLLQMDDLKIFAKDKAQLHQALAIV